MKVTGFLLREAIRRWELRRDTAANQFDDSLAKFKDEDKQSPTEITQAFVEAEVAVAKLQAAQARYNLSINVKLEVTNETVTLCEAVKRLGGAGRLEKMWRSAAGGKKDRYGGYDQGTRRADEVRAVRTVTVKESMAHANRASAVAGALRAGIAKANGTEMEAREIGLDTMLLTE